MLKAIEKPTPLPVLPPVSELETSPDPKAAFKEWAQRTEEIHAENERIFKRALKRMEWCAFWNGMLNRPLSEHFSWCPHTDWDNYWQEAGWPPLP